ncbi:MAG: type 4a pilus biogenesis protein PilO [Desulfatirhabdiaceae bacterium]
MNLSQRHRRHFLAAAFLAVCLLSWWAQVFDPLQEKIQEQQDDMARQKKDYRQLLFQQEQLAPYQHPDPSLDEDLARLTGQLVLGKQLEELNPGIQTVIQELVEKNGMTFKSYKDLPSVVWKRHLVVRTELQLEAGLENLANFLQALEDMPRMVRIEKLTVTSRRAKEVNLLVLIQLGALYIEETFRP